MRSINDQQASRGSNETQSLSFTLESAINAVKDIRISKSVMETGNVVLALLAAHINRSYTEMTHKRYATTKTGLRSYRVCAPCGD